jgi:hypothetical protein
MSFVELRIMNILQLSGFDTELAGIDQEKLGLKLGSRA